MPERFLGRSLGKFRIDAIVGSGGFAWVYKAFDPELEIPVALKILKPQYAGDEKFEQRFRREASTAARLRHPNIVKIFAVGKEGDAVYFAMDYLPQGLSDRLEVMNMLPENMLIRMGIDVASAIGFAHREGVIHRDIKADNILFDEHGNAIVADFGIARAVSAYAEETGTNMVVGTPQYFAPEQARGQPLDGRADIYSLGVTLFKASTGVLPFSGDDWYEIARQHVEDKPPKPRALNPALSPDLEEIILRCLEKNAEDRYDSGELLCQELATLLQERGESATFRTQVVPAVDTAPSPVVELPRARRRRQKLQMRVAVGAGLLALLVGGPILWASRRGEAANSPAGSDRAARTASQRASAGVAGSRDGSAPPVDAGPPLPPVLDVIAPLAAQVTVNGVAVGKGKWRTDTLGAGTFVVAAQLDSQPNCPSTRREQRVTLGETGVQQLRLSPRACGQLRLDIRPEGATYDLRSYAGDRPIRGQAPTRGILTLPIGNYRMVVESRFCAPYRTEVRVTPETQSSARVRLICDKG